VGALFEQFEGRESELRSALRSVLVGLRTGDIKEIRQHNPNDTTACIPLIDNFVVVLEPMDNFFFVSRRSSKTGYDFGRIPDRHYRHQTDRPSDY